MFDNEYVLFTEEEARNIFEEIEYEKNKNRTIIIITEVTCNANFNIIFNLNVE